MLTQGGKLLYISDNAAEYLGHSMVSFRNILNEKIYVSFFYIRKTFWSTAILYLIWSINKIMPGSKPNSSERLILLLMKIVYFSVEWTYLEMPGDKWDLETKRYMKKSPRWLMFVNKNCKRPIVLIRLSWFKAIIGLFCRCVREMNLSFWPTALPWRCLRPANVSFKEQPTSSPPYTLWTWKSWASIESKSLLLRL